MRFGRAVTVLLVLASGACGSSTDSSGGTTPGPLPVATVNVSPPSATAFIGATQALTATTRDASGNVLTGRTVTWSTSNAAIASVSTSGLVTAVAAGNATILATSEGIVGAAAITETESPDSGSASATTARRMAPRRPESCAGS